MPFRGIPQSWSPIFVPLFSLSGFSRQEPVIKSKKAWAMRGAETQANWSKVRPALAAALVAAASVPEVTRVCTACNCNRICVVRCKSCTPHEDGYALFCRKCDKAAHPHAHFHQREG
eukprot:9476983-Pyramimonas_sp.AAC.2